MVNITKEFCVFFQTPVTLVAVKLSIKPELTFMSYICFSSVYRRTPWRSRFSQGLPEIFDRSLKLSPPRHDGTVVDMHSCKVSSVLNNVET